MFLYIETDFILSQNKTTKLMPLSDYPSIQSIIDGDYDFRFGDYVSDGVKLFRKEIGSYIGFIIILLISTTISAVLPFMVLPPMFAIFVAIFSASFVLYALIGGFNYFAYKSYGDQSVEFADFFKGFSFSKDIFLRVVTFIIITTIVSLPFYYFQYESGYFDWLLAYIEDPTDVELAQNQPSISPAAYFLQIPYYYFMVAYLWADLFIVLKGMSFWDAMEASRQIITKKWFYVAIFTLVVGIIGMSGFIAFCIGFIFTVPLSMCMNYVAFADVTKLNENTDPESDILDHLVDGLK